MTEETRQVAVATAEELDKQTGQLEKMDNDMNGIQVLVERSEKTVDKVIRPWYARVPGRGKVSKKDKETKKNRKQKGSITEIVEEEPEEQPPTSELTEPVENIEGMRGDLLGDRPADGAVVKEQKPPRPRAKPRRTGPNAELLDELDKAEEEQENQLSEISATLRDLKGIASGINQELSKQSVLIDGLDQSADMTTERIEANNMKLKRII
eukprot:CAMPEP_0184752772 /NCGR_PEP_ID=MMETSP0315-20130426/43756_1 /TAXON_ID=101924 /ORGANISM="Rhodosorus marinus, Strain UTEX LB 2760" /LENGTH=209 /DNA_ID=CAMNT_0027232125 /DNA_START=779 /DNA_END=1408 /DNA_ORIENTATION=+